jgi:hypothetical protein
MRTPEAAAQPPNAARRSARRIPRLPSLRGHRWSATQRAVVIALVAIVSGLLFITSYSLALGDPVPHRIDAALVGDPTSHPRTVGAAERVADGGLVLHRYGSVPAALQAIDEQHVYAALDLTATRPTLYLASAAGASVARVLEQISTVDPAVRVVDTHPLGTHDPNGLETFYLMVVATIVLLLANEYVIRLRDVAGVHVPVAKPLAAASAGCELAGELVDLVRREALSGGGLVPGQAEQVDVEHLLHGGAAAGLVLGPGVDTSDIGDRPGGAGDRDRDGGGVDEGGHQSRGGEDEGDGKADGLDALAAEVGSGGRAEQMEHVRVVLPLADRRS